MRRERADDALGYEESADALNRRRRKALKQTTALAPTHPPKPYATGPPMEVGELVPDKLVAAEFHVTLMCLWRWTRDEPLGFPQVIKIGSRNYRRRVELEEFKQRMVRRATGQSGKHRQPEAA